MFQLNHQASVHSVFSLGIGLNLKYLNKKIEDTIKPCSFGMD